jgi:hypothetical protein
LRLNLFPFYTLFFLLLLLLLPLLLPPLSSSSSSFLLLLLLPPLPPPPPGFTYSVLCYLFSLSVFLASVAVSLEIKLSMLYVLLQMASSLCFS